MNWTVVGSIAAAISALAVAISLLLLFFQLRRLRLAQEVTAALALYDRSTTPEMMQAAAWVKREMPADLDYRAFRSEPETRTKLEQLWYYFEFLGVLVVRGYISEDIIFDQQGAFIAGVWDKTQHLIWARRDDRRSPQYLENFEILRSRFDGWAARNKPKLEPGRTRRIQGYYENEAPVPQPKKAS